MPQETEDVRIIDLHTAENLVSGMYVPTDHSTNGTEKFDLNTIRQVPASSANNANDVLMVNQSGTPEWSEIRQVPNSTQQDASKVLTVSQVGAPVWATASGGGSSAQKVIIDTTDNFDSSTLTLTVDNNCSYIITNSTILSNSRLVILINDSDNYTANISLEFTAPQNMTLYMKHANGELLKYAVAAGNQVASGKYHQATAVGNCWTTCEFSGPEYSTPVTFENQTYRTVKIGNQIWMAENLNLAFDGLTIGETTISSSQAQANYCNNNKASYEKYGLLYNWQALNLIETNKATLIPGWRVPTKEDWDTLGTTVNDTARDITAVSGWGVLGTLGGNDKTGFGALPAGYYDGSSKDMTLYADFGTLTTTESKYKVIYIAPFSGYTTINNKSVNLGYCSSLRLIKES